MASFTPPELRWTRRDALERGMGSIAALCLLPAAARTARLHNLSAMRW